MINIYNQQNTERSRTNEKTQTPNLYYRKTKLTNQIKQTTSVTRVNKTCRKKVKTLGIVEIFFRNFCHAHKGEPTVDVTLTYTMYRKKLNIKQIKVNKI